jgi:hypothetical protein
LIGDYLVRGYTTIAKEYTKGGYGGQISPIGLLKIV